MNQLLFHPLLYFWNFMPREGDYGATGFAVVALCGILSWFFFTRLLAEMPGRTYGYMHLWWAVFFLTHIYGFAIYIIYDTVVYRYAIKDRIVRRIRLKDSSTKAIEDSARLLAMKSSRRLPELEWLIADEKLTEALNLARSLREIALGNSDRELLDIYDTFIERIQKAIDENTVNRDGVLDNVKYTTF